MKLRNKYIISLLVFVCFAVCPSGAQLKFVQKEHDFGKLLWYSEAHATFSVMNKGAKATSISEIRTSNSAILVEWPRSPILPGAYVEIKVTLRTPLVGFFDKTLSLYAEGSSEMQDRMHLKGNVLMKEQEERNTDAFPNHVGKIYLNTDNVEFDEVIHGQYPQQVISVYNAGSDVYMPELMHLPKYLTVEAIPTRVLPGRVGKMILTLDSRKLSTMGLTQTSVYVSRFQGDNVGKENEISVSAVLVPSYDSTSVVQRELSPRLNIASTTIQLPAFGKKKKVKGKILLSNSGKSSLEVSNLQVFNPAVSVSLSKTKIAPGEESTLKVTVNKEMIGISRGRLRILMITNDPNQSKVIFDIKIAK